MISYAQNLEDVVLNRVFQNMATGFYIDVGAHDPVELSVTKFFHDLGWRGINIEPVPASFRKFEKARPQDINLNLALGAHHDFKTIYEVMEHPELTSLDRKVAEAAALSMKTSVRPAKVEVRTLAEICEQHCKGLIDFIKIDVEGYEREVIEGANWSKFRPTMLVVEATIPNIGSIVDWDRPDEIGIWDQWETIVLHAGYIFVYYDALNRYYLRKEDAHMKNRFCVPVNWVQDQFQLFRDIRDKVKAQGKVKVFEQEKKMLEITLKECFARQAAFDEEIAERERRMKTLLNQNAALLERIGEVGNQKDALVKKLSEVEADHSFTKADFERMLLVLQGELDRNKEVVRVLASTLKQERWEGKHNFFQQISSLGAPLLSFIGPSAAGKGTEETDRVKESSFFGVASIAQDDARPETSDFLLYGPGCEKVAETIRQTLEDKWNFIFALDEVLTGDFPLPDRPWCGLLHATPIRIPEFLAEAAAFRSFVSKSLFSNENWTRAGTNCKRLFVFSEEHVQNVRGKLTLPLQVVRRPLPYVNQTWSWERFKNNPTKKVIQVGWWLQRLHAIHALPVNMEKLWIRKPNPEMEEVLQLEEKHLRARFIIFDHSIETVRTLEDLTLNLYETLLCENVAFVHFYDAKNLDLVTQCIARRTPLLVNPLPAVREYLGDAYPLYYYSYFDAASKSDNFDLLLKAHVYLDKIAAQFQTGPQALAMTIRENLQDTIH